MEKYINVLRCIVKNFNMRKNNEFDNIIKYIINKIFDEYYNNRDKSKYCIDNLYKKYDICRYNFIKKKYRIIKNENLIFRFNRYSKKSYIIKLLNENLFVDKNENYKSIADNILKTEGIKNHRRYIDHTFVENKICFYPPCLKWVTEGNYFHLHNKFTN